MTWSAVALPLIVVGENYFWRPSPAGKYGPALSQKSVNSIALVIRTGSSAAFLLQAAPRLEIVSLGGKERLFDARQDGAGQQHETDLHQNLPGAGLEPAQPCGRGIFVPATAFAAAPP